ncbi:MAG: hypothetical protein ACO1SX_25950 [Actinomycetota bacterium]
MGTYLSLKRSLTAAALLVGGAVTVPGVTAAEALRSGPQPGARPLPFTSNMVTGPHRGKQYCYVCELKDEPAVLVFARNPDENTGRLLRTVRDAVRSNEKSKLFGWMVFLAPDANAEHAVETQAYEFARKNGATGLPVSVLGDPHGPPGYLVAPEAEVTIIVFRSGKVLYNRAYRKKEWSSKAATAALKDLPQLIQAKSSAG